MELKVHNIKGKETDKKVKLNKLIFGIEPNDHAIYLDVKSYLKNQRQGNSKVKGRSEIVGSTRKIKKQKGTGTARAGSIKNPLFKGGGRVFGPRPRDYNQKVNKKVKSLARKSALTLKAKNKAIIVVEDFQFKSAKTSSFVQVLKALGIESKKSLVVFGESNKNVYLSSRNLKNSQVITNSELSTYKITDTNSLVLTESAIPQIETILKKPKV